MPLAVVVGVWCMTDSLLAISLLAKDPGISFTIFFLDFFYFVVLFGTFLFFVSFVVIDLCSLQGSVI